MDKAKLNYHKRVCEHLPEWIYDKYENDIDLSQQVDVMIEQNYTKNLHPKYVAIKIKANIEEMSLLKTV